MLRLRGALFLPALLGLSACATYNPAYGGLPFPFPGDDGSYGRRGDYGDYGRTNEWRRVDSDANRYANEVDRAIGLSSSEERGVSRVVRDRARDLLQRTPAHNHRYVYPFPRDRYDGNTRSWWSSTDRAVERVLSSRSRSAYRRWVNGDHYGGYDNRDGYYDRGRYDDDYRGRRYEEGRNRYDPVYNDARRAAARREALEVQRRREAEARRREEVRRREDGRRRYDDARRQQEAERRQADARRAQEARRREVGRRQQETRSDDRRREPNEARPRRHSDRGQDARRNDDRGRGQDDRRNDDRDRNPDAREDNDDRQRNAERDRGRNARPQRGN